MVENVFQDGLYLAAALICERVIEEKDGVKSLMRVVSRLTQQVRGPDVPDKMPPLNAALVLFLSFRTGKKPGRHDIKISLSRPDNTIAAPEQIQRINLEEPENRGGDMIINMNLGLDQEGTYWFSVYCDEYLMTKIPLSVVYFTQSTGKIELPPILQ